MKIEVLFFAQIREACGKDRETLEVPEGKTVDDVAMILFERPELVSVRSLPIVFAVNEEVVPGGSVLHDGDRLVLLSPVSGG